MFFSNTFLLIFLSKIYNIWQFFTITAFIMNMNIKFFEIPNNRIPSFCAKHQTTGTNNNVLSSDVVELSTKKQLCHKLELTDIEKEFNEVLKEYNTVTHNIKSQKELLKSYYSAQDKYDYKELLKEKSKLLNQMKRIAKKAGLDYLTMEFNIIEKKDYNRYAPKVLRANSIEELYEVQKLIESRHLFTNTQKLLSLLIIERAKTL